MERQFNSTGLRANLQRITDMVSSASANGYMIDIAKNEVDEEHNNGKFILDIEDLAFFYQNEKERNDDYDKLLDQLALKNKEYCRHSNAFLFHENAPYHCEDCNSFPNYIKVNGYYKLVNARQLSLLT